jgi:hypothetical protein
LTIYNKRVKFYEEVYQYFPSDHPIVQKAEEKYGESMYSGRANI